MSNTQNETMNAEVIAVFPNKIRISVNNLEEFRIAEEKLKVGSYLRISDNENVILIGIIENYSIEVNDKGDRRYIIEANPLGTLDNGKFQRGGDALTIPPKGVEPAKHSEIEQIYKSSMKEEEKFCFASLAQDSTIKVPVNGNNFFNKHIAVVGSTGSGKSHTVAQIIQKATCQKKLKEGTNESSYEGLNNSHIVIFDIHSEYHSAFPKANKINIEKLILPYWLLNSEELEELFLDTEANDHNQRNVFKEAVIKYKKEVFSGDDTLKDKIHYDSPLLFDIKDVVDFVKSKNEEMIDGAKGKKQGPLFGKLANFLSRLENKSFDKRLNFLLGENSKNITFTQTLEQLLGYKEDNEANVTILDVSGVPFEVLNITVSLISRLLFEYGYYYKKFKSDNETPLLLVYEEAHKYVPKSDLSRYRASKISIERIAKEGRKYGVTLMIVSQRPSEISETIFSQCNSFIAMRLTNPEDQSYVKRLLPDTLGSLTETLPSLQSGEALMIGESVIIPSLVKIEKCDPEPSSNDIKYLEKWKDEWKEGQFEGIIKVWEK